MIPARTVAARCTLALFVVAAGCSEDTDEPLADASAVSDAVSSGEADATSDATVDAVEPNDSTDASSGTDTSDAVEVTVAMDVADSAPIDALDGALDDGDAASDTASDAGDPLAGREVWVVRVGDGVTTLDGSTARVAIQRYRLDTGALLGTIPLPTTTSGMQSALTVRGNASSEAHLTRAVDGRFVTLAGYVAPPGTADVAVVNDTGSVARVIARIDAGRTVDTTTTGAWFSSGSITSAVTRDGSRYWASGNGAFAVGGSGIVYLPSHGGTVAAVNLAANVTNAVFATLVGDALWGSGGPAGLKIFELGSAAPTTSTTATALPGSPGELGTAIGMVGLALRGAEIDTFYACDGGPSATTGGVHRFVRVPGGWYSAARFTSGATAYCRHLTAFVVGSKVYIVTVANESPQRLIVFEDTVTGLDSAPHRTVATGTANYVWRGVALAPEE